MSAEVKLRRKRFATLLEGVAGARVIGDSETKIIGISYDSRTVGLGEAFIAVKGGRYDGHNYISQALERGARALILEDEAAVELAPEGIPVALVPNTRKAMAVIARSFYEDPTTRLILVGVTGTNGKSTSVYMIDKIFRRAGYESGVIGTLEYRIGSKSMKAPHTTPEAIDLQHMMSEMVDAEVTHAAMEVSSHALALHRVEGCRFKGAVFTNITPEHLDFHQNMDDYLRAKRSLFEEEQYLPTTDERINAVNADDPAGVTIACGAKGRVVTFGLSQEAQFRAEQIELRPEGSAFLAISPAGRRRVRLKLVGEFNIYNALGALAVTSELGVAPDIIYKALEELAPVRGRFERVPSKERHVFVDYSHTPDSLRRALETARALTQGRVIVVFGCGGDRDRMKRPVMGSIASQLADCCVITSDNPRSEDPRAIIEEIIIGIPREHSTCLVESDRAVAIRRAVEMARPDDLVLIAGKGHEDYQIFADRTIHFDDAEVAKEVLLEIEGGDG